METQNLCLTRNPSLNLADIRTSPREFVNPVDYEHPYDSMARFAELLALRYDANRTPSRLLPPGAPHPPVLRL
ncbi:MAG: hypothetical protein H7A47_08005 [Verrucomicrobiales bacterium]|nr:hypothetical protein [Verrucomicrobiales bacterium]